MARSLVPLLLVDNQNVMSVLNEGEFKCCPLTFEEAKAIVDMHDEDVTKEKIKAKPKRIGDSC